MKSFKQAVLGTAISLLALSIVPTALGAEPFRGNWSIAPSKQAGMVKFGINYRHGDHGQSQHESDWPVSALQGIDLATPGKHDVKFTINREAGRIDAEGFVKGGEGAGIFRFEPDPNYAPAMARLGFSVDDEEQFAMAIHDVTQEFARTMKAENLSGLDTDKLIAFRIFNVTPQFIREMRAEGLPAKEADTLIAFRVHEVTPAIVRDLRKTGLELSEDQLIAFAVHQVTPEYVAKVRAMGLGQPDADMLIALRVHDVTPEYIAKMKARGLKNLTLDQLVQLKVHDID